MSLNAMFQVSLLFVLKLTIAGSIMFGVSAWGLHQGQSYCLGAPCSQAERGDGSARDAIDFNFDWKFTLDDNSDYAQKDFDHETWQSVRLPHDWSILSPFDKSLDGATAYLPGGIGWYRKTFVTDLDTSNEIAYLHFDGIYNHSEIWLNGKKIGGRINGYTPFSLDISSYLAPQGQPNTLAIRVDRSRYIDSRWYPGAGIYRDVTLVKVAKTHVPIWGVYATTPTIKKNKATAKFDITVKNALDKPSRLKVRTELFSPSGSKVGRSSSSIKVEAGQSREISQEIHVKKPELWGVYQPNLYRAKVSVFSGRKLVDTYEINFGFRTLRYDANKGFFLNGENLPIKGVNLHHDAGLVGAAVPDEVWLRRLEILKEAGVNAIRTAHNPMSDSFMNLCDEMGFLVQAEIFDEWDNPKDKRLNQWERHSDYISRGYADYFQQEAYSDLVNAVMRDRHRPSVIMWSIGNEIEWTYPRYKKATGYFDMNASGNYFFNPPFITPEEIYTRFHESEEGEYVLADTAKKLSSWVKALDETRPVTANLILPSVSHISGYTDALDIIGYSYRRVIYDYGHKLFPEKMIMGTENVVQWHEWKAIEERDFIPGTFLWTGIDYLGEAHDGWPNKGVASGMLDTAAFKKPGYHMFKTLWNSEPHVALYSQTEEASVYRATGKGTSAEEKEPGAWETRVWYWYDTNEYWNYREGEPVIVEAISNCDELELFVNGDSVGRQMLSSHPDRIYKWALDYQPGSVTAKGLGDCKTSSTLSTAGEAAALVANVDRSELTANGYDVAHIELELVDAKGLTVRHQDKQINIVLPQQLELLGVDNGSTGNMDAYYSNTLSTHNGNALIVVRAKAPGDAEIMISGEGLEPKKVALSIAKHQGSQP